MRIASALAVFVPFLTIAQPPPGYYDSAQGLTGDELRDALHDIITPHTVIAYSQLWNAFSRSDRKPDNTVWDIYSDVPGGTPPYSYQFVTDQCGTYNSEGDCFNREHSFPVSWFNDAPPMNSDLFHIYPTDAWVNQQRGSWPFGTVSSPAYTSQNGSKRGPCSVLGCSGTAFEPIDAYKGDLARGFFYMLTRYKTEAATWSAPILSAGEFIGWVESLLLTWHAQDPVSAKETARNDSIYLMQANRNPYIDHPDWVFSIWGPEASVEEHSEVPVRAWFADEIIQVTSVGMMNAAPLVVLDVTGRVVARYTMTGDRFSAPFTEAPGTYLLCIAGPSPFAQRFVR
ncbi:MAG: endonuclease [Flavobacteriales bacterium]|nr:endonuclease [Flavobacteriales bacterium]